MTEVPEAARLPHDQLVKIGASYNDALDDNDGSLMPFADDCERCENGMVTAAPNLPPYPDISRRCKGQLDSNGMVYISTIGSRRLFAADPVTGLAMGFSHFAYLQGGRRRKVHEIEAMDFIAPYSAPSGWDG